MSIATSATTLFLVMDPLGNLPAFVTLLSAVDEVRRRRVILRESFFAFVILAIFLFFGDFILEGFKISSSALSIGGGILLFIIALRMIFPQEGSSRERSSGEPFIVPMAIPLIAGPSAIATVILLTSQQHNNDWEIFLSLIIASLACAFILLSATVLKKWLKAKGLMALEQLMGMILTTLAVQLFLNGVEQFVHQL